MKKINEALIIFFFAAVLLTANLHADSLNIETDYKLSGISYPNPDFYTGTSPDSLNYYAQRLRLTFKGNVYPNIEICTRFQAIGVMGSTVPLSVFNWQKKNPYPNTVFNPFIENIYVKASNFNSSPIEITIGRQPIEYGSGLIISDNDAGMNAIKIALDHPSTLHLEIFTAKIIEGFFSGKDFDVQGLVTKYPLIQHIIELGYFEENDHTGSIYNRGVNSVATAGINKTFLDLRLSRSAGWGHYSFEYAVQQGGVSLLDGSHVPFGGNAFVVQGDLIKDNFKFGKLTGYGIFSASTGDKGEGSVKDESFTPDFTKKYNGLTRKGWGEYFSSSISDTILNIPMINGNNFVNYSGFGTLGLGMDLSTKSGWTYGISGYSYSAAVSSSTFNVNNDLGTELDLHAVYEYSKNLNFRFAYSRYNPPSSLIGIFSKNDVSEMFLFETIFKF